MLNINIRKKKKVTLPCARCFFFFFYNKKSINYRIYVFLWMVERKIVWLLNISIINKRITNNIYFICLIVYKNIFFFYATLLWEHKSIVLLCLLLCLFYSFDDEHRHIPNTCFIHNMNLTWLIVFFFSP